MTRHAKIDFFKVVMPNETTMKFESVLQKVVLMDDYGTRNHDFNGTPIRLQTCYEYAGLWEGDMVRIRMHQVPIKAKLLSKEVGPVALEEDEGLGEETAFLYDPHTHFLVMHRLRSGVSATAMAVYFQMMADLKEPIKFQPAMTPDALKRLQQIQIIRRFELNLAGTKNTDLVSNDSGVKEFLHMQKFFETPNISITLSMGHNKGSLSNSILDTAYALAAMLGADKSSVAKLIVTGSEGEEDTQNILVNLLGDRIKETVNIPEGAGRSDIFAVRIGCVKAAWNARKEEIISTYGFPE